MDPNLNELLKSSVANSTTVDTSSDNARAPPAPSTTALAALLSPGPSDADLMLSSMSTILSPSSSSTTPLSHKLIAFDNLEQLIENLDNANNLAPLGLWTPLLSCLSDAEPQIRKMAARCVGTAVQNNVSAQERLLAMGREGVPALVRLAVTGVGASGASVVSGTSETSKTSPATATNGETTPPGEDHHTEAAAATDEIPEVQRKAIYALSSECRNYQPAMDVFIEELERVTGRTYGRVDAADMEAVDALISGLRREAAASKAAA